MRNSIPAATWNRKFDAPQPKKARPLGFSLKNLFEYAPLAMRMVREAQRERKHGHEPVLDMLRSVRTTPEMGLPLGGLGGGTIGRGWRGAFNRWHLRPGFVEYRTVAADQFLLRVEWPGSQPQAVVLAAGRPEGRGLSAWNWSMLPGCGSYHALFPRAWTVYEQPLPGIRLVCRQVSPVLPHNYKESSYPVGVFAWEVENLSDRPTRVSLLFAFQNGDGNQNDRAGGHANCLADAGPDCLALELQHVHRQPRPGKAGGVFEDPLTFAIAARQSPRVALSYCGRFRTDGNGAELWQDFLEDGALADSQDETPSAAGETIGAALAAGVTLGSGESAQIDFALAWDMPVARFGWGRAWRRRYTRFFGAEGRAAGRIAADALRDFPAWEAQIEAWQQPVLEDPQLPDWYKSALFNETYFLVEGGTLWTDGQAEQLPGAPEPLPEPEIGHFAYLEGHEYRMFNTYDVHFSASFALAMLWPALELSLQRDFIGSLGVAHDDLHVMWGTGVSAPRKRRDAIAHDLGTPLADPWQLLNGYLNQDISSWKDLNAKFVLQIYRDYVLTGSSAFLAEAYPACRQALLALQAYDRDGDGLIENEGFPDQTYDTWSMSGPSAYCGGLWLAALAAAREMAELLGNTAERDGYAALLQPGRQAYQARLWNGSYYNFDAGGGPHSDTVMADQLAGAWFAAACGLPEIVPADQARQAYETIFRMNVKGIQDGNFGAMNGVRPDGKVDRSCMQSQEMWIGTSYAVAAGMLHAGLVEQAFATARGAYQAVYQDYGLWFQTPEALTLQGVYRALGYMRPLAIWAMQWAWERRNDRLLSTQREVPGML
jgi:non-lysosomal glucosylceramidase